MPAGTGVVQGGPLPYQPWAAMKRAENAAARPTVTVEDAKVFTRPWKMAMRLHRVTDEARLFEYQCHSDDEKAAARSSRIRRRGTRGRRLR